MMDWACFEALDLRLALVASFAVPFSLEDGHPLPLLLDAALDKRVVDCKFSPKSSRDLMIKIRQAEKYPILSIEAVGIAKNDNGEPTRSGRLEYLLRFTE